MPRLSITQPAHGSVLTGPVTLAASAVGSTAGLFFKWYSSLYLSTDDSHPELNPSNHAASALNWALPVLGEFGSHALVLAATDQDGNAPAAIQAVQRAAMVGGAPLPPPLPPDPPAPCVVHQLAGAAFLNPAADGLSLSRSAATVDVLAPGTWARPNPANPALPWVANTAYQQLNGVALALRVEPDGPADEPQLALPAPPLVEQPPEAAFSRIWLTALRPRRRSPIDTNAVLLMARALVLKCGRGALCETRANA